jgi:V-type H+-transporting ATPase subunit C
VLLSDDLVKYDTVFEQAANKVADIVRNFTSGNNGGRDQLLLVNESK